MRKDITDITQPAIGDAEDGAEASVRDRDAWLQFVPSETVPANECGEIPIPAMIFSNYQRGERFRPEKSRLWKVQWKQKTSGRKRGRNMAYFGEVTLKVTCWVGGCCCHILSVFR